MEREEPRASLGGTLSPLNLRHWLVLIADRIRVHLNEHGTSDRSDDTSQQAPLVADEHIDIDTGTDSDTNKDNDPDYDDD